MNGQQKTKEKCESVPGVKQRILMSPEEIAKSGKNKIREYKVIFIPEGMKRCPQCKEIKPLKSFSFSKNTKDQKMPNCRECNTSKALKWQEEHREYKAEYWKDWRKKNGIYVSDCAKQWREENKEYKSNKDREYRENNKEYVVKKKKEYYDSNRDALIKKSSDYYHSHKQLKGSLPVMSAPMRKIKKRMGKSIWDALHGRKAKISWEVWVGYTAKDLMEHLESLFTEGMSWDNYGKKGWEIDHKVPVIAFDFTNTDSDEFRLCWSLENIQPLWAKENMAKNSKILHPELLVKFTGRMTSRPYMGRSFKNVAIG